MLCHLQKLLKPCPRRSSSVWALMLGPMMTARKLEKQQGPESHGRDIDHIGAEDGLKGSSNNAGHRLLGDNARAPPNGPQTWQDRNGVWHNWRTSETASESASTRTRNAQQTWNQKGQDWQRDRPSSSQDWRHDWQWEGDRDRTLKGSSASNTARGSQQAGPDDVGPGSDSMWHQKNAGRQAAPSGTSPGEPGKPSGPCTQPGPEPIEVPPVVEISSGTHQAPTTT